MYHTPQRGQTAAQTLFLYVSKVRPFFFPYIHFFFLCLKYVPQTSLQLSAPSFEADMVPLWCGSLNISCLCFPSFAASSSSATFPLPSSLFFSLTGFITEMSFSPAFQMGQEVSVSRHVAPEVVIMGVTAQCSGTHSMAALSLRRRMQIALEHVRRG